MKLGVIGGSGLDNPELIKDYQEIEKETSFGMPSSKIICGKIFGLDVCFLSRHGIKHEITPTNVNNQANIQALKELGCTHIISTTAVGSLKEEIKRGDFVILDQFIDFTKHRKTSFFEDFKNGAKHTPMAEPFSKFLREKIISACYESGIRFHDKGVVVTIEGPRFSTRAESNMFKILGADVINMSIAPEVILANETGIEYASIAMSTDYDCWKTDEEPVSWEAILKIFGENSEKMKKLLLKIIEKLSKDESDFLKSKIRTIPNFPKPGIMFRDITTLVGDNGGMKKVIDIFYNRYKHRKIDVVAAVESRGFIFGSLLADRLNAKLVPIRKKGKLPYQTIKQEYELEYGKDIIEIHVDAIKENERVLVIDDLIATGGTAFAACQLIEKVKGIVEEAAFVIELPELGGREKMGKFAVFSIINFEGE